MCEIVRMADMYLAAIIVRVCPPPIINAASARRQARSSVHVWGAGVGPRITPRKAPMRRPSRPCCAEGYRAVKHHARVYLSGTVLPLRTRSI